MLRWKKEEVAVSCEWTMGCKGLSDGHWHYQKDRTHPKYNKKCFVCDHCDPYMVRRSGHCGWEPNGKRLFMPVSTCDTAQ